MDNDLTQEDEAIHYNLGLEFNRDSFGPSLEVDAKLNHKKNVFSSSRRVESLGGVFDAPLDALFSPALTKVRSGQPKLSKLKSPRKRVNFGEGPYESPTKLKRRNSPTFCPKPPKKKKSPRKKKKSSPEKSPTKIRSSSPSSPKKKKKASRPPKDSPAKKKKTLRRRSPSARSPPRKKE
mmetsp:Transcript_30102/g.45992  ORF Transcript_30102/g.45992 Transcript_30102/m.45992 type:complete len:179 (-) Transcript_30102:19-555(-)